MMNFPNYFADAETDYNDSDFVIFGLPYDKTSSFRSGAALAPKQIRESSWNFETYNIRTGIDFIDLKVHDYGDLDIKNNTPSDMFEKVKVFSKKIIDDRKFPIMIGGEHSVTPGVVHSFSKDIAVLCLDAHLDFRDSYENEKFNHACVIRRISDYIDIKNIGVLGVRSAERQELLEAEKQGLFYADIFKIREKGIDDVIKMTQKYFGDKKIYLTLDIDVIDPAYAPGTSTPEPFGMESFDILKIINVFAKKLVGFDIVEVCPSYDHGQTSVLAAKIIRQVIEEKSVFI